MSCAVIWTVFAMTTAQARFVAEHPNDYNICQVSTAIEQLRPAPTALPVNPSNRFIAEHPSLYSVRQVYHATQELKGKQ